MVVIGVPLQVNAVGQVRAQSRRRSKWKADNQTAKLCDVTAPASRFSRLDIDGELATHAGGAGQVILAHMSAFLRAVRVTRPRFSDD